MKNAYELVCLLSLNWKVYNGKDFRLYLRATFGCETIISPVFQRILIAQARDGNAKRGVIGGQVERWWVVAVNGIEDYDGDDIDLSATNGFYCQPILKFFADENWIAIGEKLGPHISCRKVGAIKQVNNAIEIEGLRVIWNSNNSTGLAMI